MIAKDEVNKVPLWNSTYFSTPTGTLYVSPKLVWKGVTTVGDKRKGRSIDEEKLKDIAPTWRPLYSQRVDWIIVQEEMAEKGIALPGERMPEGWKLRDMQRALAKAEMVAPRQGELVWKALKGAKTRPHVRQIIRQIPWAKMRVMSRLQDKQMARTDKCSLCGVRGDHEHLLKKCQSGSREENKN